MADAKDKLHTMFDDYFAAYKASAKYKDDARFEIAFRKEEFEKLLNDMWAIYKKGNIAQLQEYNKQLKSIKDTGCRVFRNSEGLHKIKIG